MRLAQSKDGHESLVDAPLLLRAHPAHKLAEPGDVDRADLLNQDAGGLPEQVDLWPERCLPGVAGRWRDQYHRARQEFVGLDDHAISSAVLIVADAAWHAELVNITPLHA
jgi:hypothetical protein